MKKSSSKREVSQKKSKSGGKVTKVIHESTREIKIDRALIDNFVAIQKVMVNLSAKFDHLSGQISKLLELFEISAKSLVRKDMEDNERQSMESKKIMEKLDNIAQQASLIGKGLVLIHESGTERGENLLQKQPQPTQQSQQTTRQITPMGKTNPQFPGLQKSPQQRTFEADS